MTEIAVVVRIDEVSIICTAGVGFFPCLFHIEALALIRGEQTERRAQFQVLVSIGNRALETQTELRTRIAVDLIAGILVIADGSVFVLQRTAQIQMRFPIECVAVERHIVVIRSSSIVIGRLSIGFFRRSGGVVDSVLVCTQRTFTRISLVPALAHISRCDTTCDRRQINREISAFVALLPVDTDRDIGVRRSQPFRNDVVVAILIVTTDGVLALERTQNGQIPGLLELPTELRSQLDVIARFLERILFLLNPRHSVVRIEVGLPSDCILVVKQVEFGVNETVHVVLTSGCPVDQTGCRCVQTHCSVKFPCFFRGCLFLCSHRQRRHQA